MMGTSLHIHPEVVLAEMGRVGRRLTELGASEGGAGNLSVCLRQAPDITRLFPVQEPIALPQPIPELAGAAFFVTGSGCRLGDIREEPAANIGCIVVAADGLTGSLCTTAERCFSRLTSEFNSHLAVHSDQMQRSGADLHAVAHAQPPHLTYLSHILRYQDEDFLNRHLLRWQPEMILQFPEGIGIAPFLSPGSDELMQASVISLRTRCLMVWSKHGVMARSDSSLLQACDRVEYAEAAARYEYLNLAIGEPAAGLSPEEIRRISAQFGIHQTVF